MKFRKKPIVIDAVRWTGKNLDEIFEFTDADDIGTTMDKNELLIPTLEGLMKGSVGDWLIRGVNGEYYPCKPDIFEKTYERVYETAPVPEGQTPSQLPCECGGYHCAGDCG